jgi:hypothetical protein
MNLKMPLLFIVILMTVPAYAGYMGIPAGAGMGGWLVIGLFALVVWGVIELYYWLKKKLIAWAKSQK